MSTSGEQISDIVLEKQVLSLASSVTDDNDNTVGTEVDLIYLRSLVAVENKLDSVVENLICLNDDTVIINGCGPENSCVYAEENPIMQFRD